MFLVTPFAGVWRNSRSRAAICRARRHGDHSPSLGEQALAAFEHIESRPIASASIAQVHAARLITGEGVVIKVVRPCVEGQIRREMGALIELAAWLAQRLPILRQLHLPQIMRDQLAVMLAELSMFSGGAQSNPVAAQLRGFTTALRSPALPTVHSAEPALVMERIEAPSIGELDRLRDAGVDFKVLAHKGVETFFTQVFDDNFFHADMHPGNVFVDITDPKDPRWIALDCAIVGSLSESDQSLSRTKFDRIFCSRLPPNRQPAPTFWLDTGGHRRRCL